MHSTSNPASQSAQHQKQQHGERRLTQRIIHQQKSPRFRLGFVEQAAVLRWLEFGGFSRAAGFQLRSELFAQQLLFTTAAVVRRRAVLLLAEQLFVGRFERERSALAGLIRALGPCDTGFRIVLGWRSFTPLAGESIGDAYRPLGGRRFDATRRRSLPFRRVSAGNVNRPPGRWRFL